MPKERVGSGGSLGGTGAIGGARGDISGVLVGLDKTRNADNPVIDGRVIGGGTGNFQLVSGFELNAPPVTPVPAPPAVVLIGLGLGAIALERRGLRGAA